MITNCQKAFSVDWFIVSFLSDFSILSLALGFVPMSSLPNDSLFFSDFSKIVFCWRESDSSMRSALFLFVRPCNDVHPQHFKIRFFIGPELNLSSAFFTFA